MLLASATLLAGCFSMDIATTASLKKSALSPEDGRPMEHVVVANYGWYIFNWIPIACGNSTPNARFPWKFFSNQVEARLLHDRMMSHAASLNANVRDLTVTRNEQVFFTIPGLDYPLPIPYVLCYREIQFSGVLTQRKPDDAPTNERKPKNTVEEMNQLLNKLNPEEGN